MKKSNNIYYNIMSNVTELKINCKLLWFFYISYLTALRIVSQNSRDISTCFSYDNNLKEREIFILARGLSHRDIR